MRATVRAILGAVMLVACATVNMGFVNSRVDLAVTEKLVPATPLVAGNYDLLNANGVRSKIRLDLDGDVYTVDGPKFRMKLYAFGEPYYLAQMLNNGKKGYGYMLLEKTRDGFDWVMPDVQQKKLPKHLQPLVMTVPPFIDLKNDKNTMKVMLELRKLPVQRRMVLTPAAPQVGQAR